MRVFNIGIDNKTFTHKHKLKTLFKKGKLPFVKYGFYGELIDKDIVTIEHVDLFSKGGKTEWKNIVLTSADMNMIRGNKPLSQVINWESVGRYLDQFRNNMIGNYPGNKYIAECIENISKVLRKEKANGL